MLPLKDLVVIMMLASASALEERNAHDVENREVSSEQDRIYAYQIKIQNYINARETGAEMDQTAESLRCYSCDDARTNEECNKEGIVTCLPTQSSCQTEIRVFNPQNWVNIRIKKGCKQDRACSNNFYQNDKASSPSTQCNNVPGTLLSVCRYCCAEAGCNRDLPEHICRSIAPPVHGSVTCKQNDMQAAVCSFQCKPCYELTGSTVRMCLHNAMWSGKETKCTHDETKPGCGIPKTCRSDQVRPPVNGDVECTNANEPGSECRFFCHKGYFLAGQRVLRCNGDWNAETPTCVRGDDGSNPCHVFAVFDFDTNGQLQCECSTGFKGNGFTNCQDMDECEEEMDSCNENADCINAIGSYRCQCRSGYRGNGIECGDINECTSRAHDCHPVNGICINNDGSYSCTCAPEYTGDGKECEKLELDCPGMSVGDLCITSERQPLHDFADETPVLPPPGALVENPDESAVFTTSLDNMDSCLRLVERKPSIIRDAHDYELLNERLLRKLVESSNYTTIVHGPWIGLDDRLEPGTLRWRDGRPLRRKDFKPWAPGQPKMIDSEGFGNCVDLVSDPVGAQTTSFLWQITLCNQRARYVCDTERSDEPLISLCLPLIDVANGRMFCTNGWRPGSTCSYSCDNGYILRGASSRVGCREQDRTWDNEPPVCVRAVCSRPLMPPNSGFMTCTNENKENSVCTFVCHDGFNLHGNETVTCQRNLRWSSQRPCCRDDCPPYARMNLILVLDSSRSINAENFQTIKNFAKRLHRRFELSEDFTHVSVITYSREVQLLNDQSVFTSNDELNLALDKLPYEGSGTFIGKALNYVSRNLAGKRPGSGDVVIVLTDGISHDDVFYPSRNLQNMGAHIIAVGVRHAWRYQLRMIASEPHDVNVVEVENYDDLDNIVDVIGGKVCHLSC